jgi:hypothetical protein
MHREETPLAEVSCLKKLQTEAQHDAVTAVPDPSAASDAEKGQVKADGDTITSQMVVGNQQVQTDGEKGVLAQNHPDSDSSSVTAYDEKDDFPEGGLKG